MEPRELRRALEKWTEENSGFEERGYLGMSQIWRCPAGLYDDMVNGRRRFRGRAARMCYEGLLHERDMLERLQELDLYTPGRELVAGWDERFRGHTDGEINGLLLEMKSTTLERFEQIRQENRAPQRNYEQVQMYLLYGEYEKGVVIYKCRETGEVRPVMVWPHEPTQRRLEEKARAVLAGVDGGERPGCECGRH